MRHAPAPTHPARRTLLGLAALLTLLATLLVSSAPPSGAAETGTITGKVTTGAGRPVARAWVRIGAPVADALTASDGSFTLTGVPFGSYRVTVLSPCREITTAGILVDGNETLTLNQVPDTFLFDTDSIACRPAAAPTRLANPQDTGLKGDDAGLFLPMGFNFPYRGRGKAGVIISTNGYLSFGEDDGTAFRNQPLQSEEAPTSTIFAFWDDLTVDANAKVLTGLAGTAPNRQRMIEWQNVALLTNPSLRLTVRVHLFESGRFTITWSGIDAGNELERGASATIGASPGFAIDPVLPTRTLEQSFEQPSLSSGLTVEYTRNDPPAAKAGPDRTIARGTTTTLDGSGSTDPQGKTGLKFRWTQTAGPATPITGAATAKASITTPKAKATLTYRLKVTDPFGRTSTDTVTITVP